MFFCIWWLWTLGETHIFASCFVMMLEKHWQAPKKTKHNLTKHWQAPTCANKKKTKSQHLLRTLDPHRLEIFAFFVFFLGACQCFVRLCFVFCLLFWCLCKFDELVLCWKGKNIFTVFCAHFIQKSCPHGPQRKSPETVGKSCFAKWPFRSSLAR